ncbi:hypothetical protein FQZ97_603050 [compost metagenome]
MPGLSDVTVVGTVTGLYLAVLVVVDVPMAAVLFTITTKLTVCVTFGGSEATTKASVLPVAVKSMALPATSPCGASVSAVPGALLQTAEPGTYVKPAGNVSVMTNRPAAPPVLLNFNV